MNLWFTGQISNAQSFRIFFECPDNLVTFDSRSKSYGLIIHDGGSSSIEMMFCPWCGKSIATENV
ncbi:MAG: DUF6980 family protein [Methylophilaceae bacterium]